MLDPDDGRRVSPQPTDWARHVGVTDDKIVAKSTRDDQAMVWTVRQISDTLSKDRKCRVIGWVARDDGTWEEVDWFTVGARGWGEHGMGGGGRIARSLGSMLGFLRRQRSDRKQRIIIVVDMSVSCW